MSIWGKLKNFFWLVLTIAFLLLAIKIIIGEIKIQKKAPAVTPTPTVMVNSGLVELIKVIDGDTVIVKIDGQEKSVRLIGIDAPEKDECYAKEATEKMKGLVENKKIKLESDNSQDDKDKYDRLLRYIYLDDGTLINEKMVEDGFAREYTYKVAYKFQMEFREDQTLAKTNNLGLWKECN